MILILHQRPHFFGRCSSSCHVWDVEELLSHCNIRPLLRLTNTLRPSSNVSIPSLLHLIYLLQCLIFVHGMLLHLRFSFLQSSCILLHRSPAKDDACPSGKNRKTFSAESKSNPDSHGRVLGALAVKRTTEWGLIPLA